MKTRDIQFLWGKYKLKRQQEQGEYKLQQSSTWNTMYLNIKAIVFGKIQRARYTWKDKPIVIGKLKVNLKQSTLIISYTENQICIVI